MDTNYLMPSSAKRKMSWRTSMWFSCAFPLSPSWSNSPTEWLIVVWAKKTDKMFYPFSYSAEWLPVSLEINLKLNSWWGGGENVQLSRVGTVWADELQKLFGQWLIALPKWWRERTLHQRGMIRAVNGLNPNLDIAYYTCQVNVSTRYAAAPRKTYKWVMLINKSFFLFILLLHIFCTSTGTKLHVKCRFIIAGELYVKNELVRSLVS